jgi:hypothetical protein
MRALLGGVMLAAALAAQGAPPVAFVADIRGNATVEGDGKLAFLAELGPGTRLLLGSNAMVAITYATTGAEFTLLGPGEFLVTVSEVKAEKGAPPKRRTVTTLPDSSVIAQVSRNATASLRMRGITPGEKAALHYPVNTRVATLEPTHRWGGAPDASYTLVLADTQGKELWKGSARPEGTRPPVRLSPATRYKWTVMTPNGVVGEAQFETLPPEAIARAEKSRSAARSFPERVLHAVLLQGAGATQDAREAWAALARERPDLPELAVLAR